MLTQFYHVISPYISLFLSAPSQQQLGFLLIYLLNLDMHKLYE